LGAREDRLAGVLVGTAIGDALGLPLENLSARRIERLFGRVGRYRLLGHTGFVSDDTEQSAFVAQALVEAHGDPAVFARSFARKLKGWILRLPFGVGFATLRACLKLLLGVSPGKSGVRSAGNGAAMRAAIVGAFFAGDPARRVSFGEALARVTHTDPRAIEGAQFVAALAAQAVRGPAQERPDLEAACGEVHDALLREAIQSAQRLARDQAATADAARALGVTGYVVHTVAFAAFCAARHGSDARRALEEAVNAGGDADTIGAIVGALVGARHGLSGLPKDLCESLEDGPLGRRHLVRLAQALANGEARAPGYSATKLLLRNVLLVPVILGHVAFRVVGLVLPRRAA
jgi:ADP-ribosyl-[dinitrogen reductase] hydrolase